MKKIVLAVMTTALCAYISMYSMEKTGFDRLLVSIDKQNFSDDKLNLLKEAAQNTAFSASQVALIINKFSFSSDKLQALEILKNSIEDPQNAQIILQSFEFSADQIQAKKILAGARPAEPEKNNKPDNAKEKVCSCNVECSAGKKDIFSVPYDESQHYMDKNCESKAYRFCESYKQKVRKADVSCY